MKTLIKMLFIATPLGSMLFFNSCLSSDGENAQTFGREPLVVNSSIYSTTKTVSSRYGTFIAPELSSEFENGDCLAANFKINFDNQTDADYYTLSDFVVLGVIPSSSPTQSADSVITDFEEPIKGVSPIMDNNRRIYLINDRIFLAIAQKSTQGRNFAYEMVWTESNFTYNGYPVLYISGKPEAAAVTPATDDAYDYAFNLSEFKTTCVNVAETTSKYLSEITENGSVYKKLEFYIKYRTDDKEVKNEAEEVIGTSPDFKFLGSSSTLYSVVWLKQ